MGANEIKESFPAGGISNFQSLIRGIRAMKLSK